MPEKPKAVPKRARGAQASPDKRADALVSKETLPPQELGGRDGPEPTRFGDWEKNGRCIDF